MVKYGLTTKTASIEQYSYPQLFHSWHVPGQTMQDFIFLPAQNMYIMSQVTPGTGAVGHDGNVYESTLLTRVNASTGRAIDSMTLVNAGHGFGFEGVYDSAGNLLIWLCWHGRSDASHGRENDYVRVAWAPGTFTRAEIIASPGYKLMALQDPEATYHFDWATNTAVERHYNFDSKPRTETYKRRKISDVNKGVNTLHGVLTLPVDRKVTHPNPSTHSPTTQGFGTINNTFFRWLGYPTDHNTSDSNNPITLEQYSWITKKLISRKTYPSLGKQDGSWLDGHREPEGLAIYREVDGTASLLVGLTTGHTKTSGGSGHQFSTFRFANIGKSK